MNIQEVKKKIPRGGYDKISQRAKVHKTTLLWNGYRPKRTAPNLNR